MNDGLDQHYLAPLLKAVGMDRLSEVTHCSPATAYQWRPSRSRVPAEAALRLGELPEVIADPRFWVEQLRPELPWHLLYRGRDRRAPGRRRGALTVAAAVKAVGPTAIAQAAGRTRQGIYPAMRQPACPVWLAFAIEQASEARYLVEDFRDLPWWPLYERYRLAYPLEGS